jgi:hypothetical protein
MPENNKEIEEKIDQEIKNRLNSDVKKEVEELLQKDFLIQKLASKIEKNISGSVGSQKIDNRHLNSKDNFKENFSDKKTDDQEFGDQDEDEAADQLEKNKRKSSLDRQKKESDINNKNRKGPKTDSRPIPMREEPTKTSRKDENIKKESPESSLDNLNKNNKSGASETKKEAQLSADKKAASDVKASKASSSASSDSVSGIEKFTKAVDELLKSAWENLIDSFGLTLLYIYFHWFMHQLFPKFFCDLGQEWVPAEVKEVSPDAAKAMGKKVGLVEKALVGWTCLILLVSCLQMIIIIYLILNAWGIIVDTAWSWVTGIFS